MANALSNIPQRNMLAQAALDPAYWREVRQGLADAMGRGLIGGIVGAPVDIANLALTPFGYGSKMPVMGSEWIGQQMQNAGIVSGNRNALAEGLASFIDPATAGVGAAKTIGVVGVGSVASDIKKLKSLLTQSGIPYDISKSAKSPSTYFKLQTPDGDIFNVRVSDHQDYHLGGNVSIDPETGVSFNDAVKAIKDAGFPIESKIKRSRKTVDDATLLKIFHGDDPTKTIADVPTAWADSMRSRLKWQDDKSHKMGGYWTEK